MGVQITLIRISSIISAKVVDATSTTNTFQNFSYGHGKFTSLADGDGLLNLSLTPNY